MMFYKNRQLFSLFRKKQLILLMFFTILILPITALSLYQVTMVVIKGSFTEEGTNNPIATNMQFTDSDGKTVECKSNASSGEFQQVLKPNTYYTLSSKGYIITPGKEHFSTPKSDEYLEIRLNFTAQKITEGIQIMNIQAFKPNDSVLTYEAKQSFTDLKAFLRYNIAVSVNIELSSYDSYFKDKRVKEEYYKGKTRQFKWINISTKEQLARLLNDRERSIRNYFDEIKIYTKNVEFSHNLQIVPDSKKVQKRPKAKGKGFETYIPDYQNTKITISKVRNL